MANEVAVMNPVAIEKSAWELLAQIWDHKKYLWPTGCPRPIDMIEPEIAARVLGINYVEHEELKGVGSSNSPYEIAGLIDRQKNQIAISKRFPIYVMRFTGAHELGHHVLHPHDRILHRDPPLNGLGSERPNRDYKEREADYFAACFLMPRKLLKKAQKETFGESPIYIDDATAFWLNPGNASYLMRAEQDSLTCEDAVAGATSYGRGNHFQSLADQFRVSHTSMAIRLRELGLVRY